MRPTWDVTWMSVAESISHRSRCVKRQAGAAIAQGKRLISVGYNGPPADWEGANDDANWCNEFCPRTQRPVGTHNGNDYSNCVTVHAEANALLWCDRRDREGGALYVFPGSPCFDCAKLISNSGIQRVVLTPPLPQDLMRGNDAIDMLVDSGLAIQTLDWEPKVDPFAPAQSVVRGLELPTERVACAGS
jgi:dCMP deaminase